VTTDGHASYPRAIRETMGSNVVLVCGAKWKRPVERVYRITLPLKHADSPANRLNLRDGNPLERPVVRVPFRTAY
jgi:hypothetical protein